MYLENCNNFNEVIIRLLDLFKIFKNKKKIVLKLFSLLDLIYNEG